jgi:inositol phosphorylceramide mannosyltransferase catalytic subunit
MEDGGTHNGRVAELRISTQMIPRITHQIWLGNPIPQHLAGYRQRMIELNPHFVHELWGEGMLKAIGFDCTEAAKRFPTLAGVSNAARLYVLREFGGLYFDLDFVPLKPLDALLKMGDALAAEQGDGRVCNAFMAATPKHPWICYQCDHVPEYEGIAAFWGVELATRAPREGLTIIPQHITYPFRWDDPPEKRHEHPDTIMLHTWDGSWLPKQS